MDKGAVEPIIREETSWHFDYICLEISLNLSCSGGEERFNDLFLKFFKGGWQELIANGCFL